MTRTNRILLILYVIFLLFALLFGFRKMLFHPQPNEQKERIPDPYQDTFGGKTPDETLTLYISALKRGDIDTASRYFELSLQKAHREELKVAQQKDNLAFLLSVLSKERRGKEIYPGYYQFTIVENGSATSAIVLILNSATHIWKLRSI